MYPPSIPFWKTFSPYNTCPWISNIPLFLNLSWIHVSLFSLDYSILQLYPLFHFLITMYLLHGLSALWRVWVCDTIYLQANKLACLHFMGAGRNYETTGSEKKALLQHSKEHELNGYISSFWPSSHMVMIHNLSRCCVHSGLLVRNSQLKKSQSFIMGWKQTYGTFAVMGHIIFIMMNRKQISAQEQDSISIFQGCLLYKHLWKDHPEQKAVSPFAFKTCRNIRDPWTLFLKMPWKAQLDECN